jgi:hypothetical protein
MLSIINGLSIIKIVAIFIILITARDKRISSVIAKIEPPQ